MRDLRRLISGPAYARYRVKDATGAGAEIRARSMVTGWADDTTVDVSSPDGRYRIRPRAIVLATGARERPRTARRIPGDRPHGIYTTGQLQNLVHLHHQPVGKRAVIVGGELVSWSAAVTLREAGCTPALMVSQYPKAQAPLLVAGTNGPFDVHDDSGNAVKTQMNVKVESAKYVTATELGTSKKPEHGQYVALKLTLKNVSKAPGRFAAYGAMMWQDAKTAPQDCTTLEIVDGPDLDTEYAPGQSATGTIILDIPRKGGTVTYYDAPGAGAFAVLLPSS
ncbi:FAD-dependent oxidoreductase [Streptomyces sp. NBC_00356]|uniref:FAD-dependent oxidoreductase n=1 Tax=Streptomyces sp. NBC_00356 TaxID=2975724 RepID=UPI002E25C993